MDKLFKVLTMKQYPIRLTRYLYFLDEAIYTLMDRMVHKNADGFNEIVWWCGEIYYSGFYEEIWDFIFSFYYNFKCIIYPKYEKLLCGFYKSFQEKKDIGSVLSALKILYHGKCDFTVFTSWSNDEDLSIKLFAGRPPKWLKDLNIKRSERNMVRSIHNKNYENVLYYIKNGEINRLYDAIIEYFKQIHNFNLSKKRLEDVPYLNKRHILFALVYYLYQPIETIEKKAIYIEYEHDEYENQLNNDNKMVKPAYKTLGEKLRYPISENIGCFPLNRYMHDYKKAYRHHWEFYAYETPLWKKRFDKYSITVNESKKEICFSDDIEYEEFGEEFYFENDEQTQKIQDYSIKIIPKISLKEWSENNIIINKLKTIKTENIIVSYNGL